MKINSLLFISNLMYRVEGTNEASSGGATSKKSLRNTDVIYLLNLPSDHFPAGFPLLTYIYIPGLHHNFLAQQ